MENLMLALSDKHKPYTSPNPFNIFFVAKFEIITSTYAKLFINPKGLELSDFLSLSLSLNPIIYLLNNSGR